MPRLNSHSVLSVLPGDNQLKWLLAKLFSCFHILTLSVFYHRIAIRIALKNCRRSTMQISSVIESCCCCAYFDKFCCRHLRIATDSLIPSMNDDWMQIKVPALPFDMLIGHLMERRRHHHQGCCRLSRLNSNSFVYGRKVPLRAWKSNFIQVFLA